MTGAVVAGSNVSLGLAAGSVGTAPDWLGLALAGESAGGAAGERSWVVLVGLVGMSLLGIRTSGVTGSGAGV